MARSANRGLAFSTRSARQKASQYKQAGRWGSATVNLHASGEEASVNAVVGATTHDELTLAWVELQPNLPGGGCQPGKAGSNMAVIACEADIVKEGECEAWGSRPGTGSLQSWVQGKCKEQRAQRVPLLHNSFRGEARVPEQKAAVAAIGPLAQAERPGMCSRTCLRRAPLSTVLKALLKSTLRMTLETCPACR